MASSKNLLKQLLDEDQEPFILKNYIDERRSQLKEPVQKTNLQIKRRKPISEKSSFFCKNSCFFSFGNSPDVKMSPLFSPVKSPKNTLFVQIPSKTATILLEAALRIQKQPSSSKQKTLKSLGFGFFRSILKRITNRNRKGNTYTYEEVIKVKDVLSWDSYNGHSKITEEMREKDEKSALGMDEIRVSELGVSCSCSSRFSSAWSSNNEEKSLDLETSSSRSDISEEEIDFDNEQIKKNEEFCSSPFRFILESSSYAGEITPEFRSPVSSPSRLQKQIVNEEGKELEEEEKEQFSPVSVLDPQFEEIDEEPHEEDEENDGSQLEQSFINVQRTREQLLSKLRRFEQLAELDPIELEKRMAEEEDAEEEQSCSGEDDEDEARGDGYERDLFVKEVLSESNMYKANKRIPSDMKRLVFDLISEEEDEDEPEPESEMMKKLKKRLDMWNEVESNTVDMMVGLDYRSEGNEWRKTEEQVNEIVKEMESGIFSFLVKELSEELVHSSRPL